MKRVVASIVLAIVSVVGLSKAQAQLVVNGPKIGFRVPDPAQMYPEQMMYLRNYRMQSGLPLDWAPESVVTEKTCLKQAEVVGRIVKKIYSSNGLLSVLQNSPSILFEVMCPTAPGSMLQGSAEAFGDVAFSLASNVVVLNSLIFNYVRSEDELSYVLAHEIAHILFLHGWGEHRLRENLATSIATGKLNPVQVAPIVTTYRAETEPEADKYGMLMSWNAGYSPLVVKRTLTYIDSFPLDLRGAKGMDRLRLWWKNKQLQKQDYHGTHAERHHRVESMFGREQLREIRRLQPKAEPDFIEARNEVRGWVQQAKSRSR